MKNLYLCTMMLCFMNVLCAQYNNECSGFESDDNYFRYTASGFQTIIGGNHSKAINESRKMANIIASSELARMINSNVTRVIMQMSVETDTYMDKYSDTILVSTYKFFSGMKTVCQSETKLIDNMYVTYITKEISMDNISDMLQFENDKEKQKFRRLLGR